MTRGDILTALPTYINRVFSATTFIHSSTKQKNVFDSCKPASYLSIHSFDGATTSVAATPCYYLISLSATFLLLHRAEFISCLFFVSFSSIRTRSNPVSISFDRMLLPKAQVLNSGSRRNLNERSESQFHKSILGNLT